MPVLDNFELGMGRSNQANDHQLGWDLTDLVRAEPGRQGCRFGGLGQAAGV